MVQVGEVESLINWELQLNGWDHMEGLCLRLLLELKKWRSSLSGFGSGVLLMDLSTPRSSKVPYHRASSSSMTKHDLYFRGANHCMI